jgi:hypothetical protein
MYVNIYATSPRYELVQSIRLNNKKPLRWIYPYAKKEYKERSISVPTLVCCSRALIKQGVTSGATYAARTARAELFEPVPKARRMAPKSKNPTTIDNFAAVLCTSDSTITGQMIRRQKLRFMNI